MILKRSFFPVLLLLLCASCRVFAATPDSIITFLYVGELAPREAVLVSKQSFTGNNPEKECAYTELLQKAKNTAATLGANVVKIDKRRERNRQLFCDEISVSFYKVTDVHSIEKHFGWTKGRKLEWADFKGPLRAGAGQYEAAETSYGIAVETSTVAGNAVPKVYFNNSFETATSWVRPGHDTHAILQHEQTHFDICELYTRKMRERIGKVNITRSNLNSVIRESYQVAFRECSERQRRYDDETRHGLDDDAQVRWTKTIDEELNRSEAWMSR